MNLFETSAMAAGYSTYRPPLHALIMEKVRPYLPSEGKAACALDIGCGAGLSTNALKGIAQHRIGIEPAEAMLRSASMTAPGSTFAVARAEAIPIRARSIDLITAAGSLNYVDLPAFFREAARILVPVGVIVVYDFSPGSAFCDSDGLSQWLSTFIARYPWPPDNAAQLDPERLSRADPGFELTAHERFEIGIPLTRAFYVEYMLTETNVAFARRNGESEDAIRSWCSDTLAPVWGDATREVLFRGYFACLATKPAC